jgi:four helix bundle protein
MAEEMEKPPDICERTFEFSRRVMRLCRALEERPGVSRTLSRQLFRSGPSVGANVEEAQAGQSRADFISKCSIAVKELRETRYWLRLVISEELVTSDRVQPLLQEAEELLKILTTIVVRTKENASLP